MRSALNPLPDPGVLARRRAAWAFAATGVSVVGVQAWRASARVDPVSALGEGIVFAALLLGILGAHELGHALVARRVGLRMTWPLYVPFPAVIGTLGALMRLEETPRSREALARMAAAGPLAGLLATALVAGLCRVVPAVDPPPEALVLHAPALLWVLGGLTELSAHDPVAFAAWLGCLLTALNLLPIGQLDGGHLVTAVVPGASRTLTWFTTAVLLLGGLVWVGWPVWVAAVHLAGAGRSIEVRGQAPAGPIGRALAGACGLAFALTALPIPWSW